MDHCVTSEITCWIIIPHQFLLCPNPSVSVLQLKPNPKANTNLCWDCNIVLWAILQVQIQTNVNSFSNGSIYPRNLTFLSTDLCKTFATFPDSQNAKTRPVPITACTQLQINLKNGGQNEYWDFCESMLCFSLLANKKKLRDFLTTQKAGMFDSIWNIEQPWRNWENCLSSQIWLENDPYPSQMCSKHGRSQQLSPFEQQEEVL